MNLFIGNLHPQTSEDSLRTLFSEFGEIVSVKIPIDAQTGTARGFGFVEMADKFESFDAIDNIDGTYFEGQVISVKESKPKNPPGGGNNRGGGFNRGGNGGFNRNNDRNGGGFNRDRNSGGGGFNRERSGGGGYNRDRNSGGGYRSNDGGGFNRERSNDRGGYRSNDGGGYNRERSNDSGGFRRSYDNDRNDSNGGGAEDPNRQPGRRFSPRGPRTNDNQ